MKQNFLTLLLLGFSFLAHSQSKKNVENGLFKLNALNPGLSYEFGIGKDMTINMDALLIFGGGSTGPENFNIGFFPNFDAELRYFNNFKRRSSKGKNISGNSGNYWAFKTGAISGNALIGDYYLGYDTSVSVGAVYGLQRTYKKGFYWNLSFGPGVIFTREEFLFQNSSINVDKTFFGIVGVTKIGWVLGKRKP